jgi:hypothetical protein
MSYKNLTSEREKGYQKIAIDSIITNEFLFPNASYLGDYNTGALNVTTKYGSVDMQNVPDIAAGQSIFFTIVFPQPIDPVSAVLVSINAQASTDKGLITCNVQNIANENLIVGFGNPSANLLTTQGQIVFYYWVINESTGFPS